MEKETDTLNEKPQMKSLQSKSPLPALSESKEAQTRLDSLLGGCFTLQKMYGKQADNMANVITMFHSILGKYPAKNVIQAFEMWIERSQEFPTPADIINLVKRNGKPPLQLAVYTAINRKDPEHRSGEDWQYIKDYEAAQREGFKPEPPCLEKQEDFTEENQRLRQKLSQAEAEVKRLSQLLVDARKENPLVIKKPSEEERSTKTIQHLKSLGKTEREIQEFETFDYDKFIKEQLGDSYSVPKEIRGDVALFHRQKNGISLAGALSGIAQL